MQNALHGDERKPGERSGLCATPSFVELRVRWRNGCRLPGADRQIRRHPARQRSGPLHRNPNPEFSLRHPVRSSPATRSPLCRRYGCESLRRKKSRDCSGLLHAATCLNFAREFSANKTSAPYVQGNLKRIISLSNGVMPIFKNSNTPHGTKAARSCLAGIADLEAAQKYHCLKQAKRFESLGNRRANKRPTFFHGDRHDRHHVSHSRGGRETPETSGVSRQLLYQPNPSRRRGLGAAVLRGMPAE